MAVIADQRGRRTQCEQERELGHAQFHATDANTRQSLPRQGCQYTETGRRRGARRAKTNPSFRRRHVAPSTRDTRKVTGVGEQTSDDPSSRGPVRTDCGEQTQPEADLAAAHSPQERLRIGQDGAGSRKRSACHPRCDKRSDAKADSANRIQRQRLHDDAIQLRARPRMTPRSQQSAAHVVERTTPRSP